MSLEEYREKIVGWGVDRNLFCPHNGSNICRQLTKTLEEIGELAGGICRGNNDIVIDSIGDIYVTLVLAQKMIGGEMKLFSLDCEKSTFSALANFMHTYGKLVYHVDPDNNERVNNISTCNNLINNAMVELQVLAEVYGLSFDACVKRAWNEIKHRKGEMRNGIFIKEEDL